MPEHVQGLLRRVAPQPQRAPQQRPPMQPQLQPGTGAMPAWLGAYMPAVMALPGFPHNALAQVVAELDAIAARLNAVGLTQQAASAQALATQFRTR